MAGIVTSGAPSWLWPWGKPCSTGAHGAYARDDGNGRAGHGRDRSLAAAHDRAQSRACVPDTYTGRSGSAPRLPVPRARAVRTRSMSAGCAPRWGAKWAAGQRSSIWRSSAPPKRRRSHGSSAPEKARTYTAGPLGGTLLNRDKPAPISAEGGVWRPKQSPGPPSSRQFRAGLVHSQPVMTGINKVPLGQALCQATLRGARPPSSRSVAARSRGKGSRAARRHGALPAQRSAAAPALDWVL